MKIRINLMVLIVFLLNISTTTLLMTLSNGSVSEYLQIYITQIIPIFIPTLIYFLKDKTTGFDTVKREGKITLINVIIVILLTLLVNICINLFNQVIFAPISNLIFNGLAYNATKSFIPGSGFDIVFNVLFICLLPALFEELLFRGIVLTRYEEMYGTVKSIMMCGVVFAFLHGNITTFIPQFIVGVYLSFVVIKFNSIYYGMIAHFVHNIITLIVHIIWNNNYSYLINITKHWFLTLIISITLIYVLIAISNITNKRKTKTIKPASDENQQKVKKSEKTYFNIIVAVYIILQLITIIFQII